VRTLLKVASVAVLAYATAHSHNNRPRRSHGTEPLRQGRESFRFRISPILGLVFRSSEVRQIQMFFYPASKLSRDRIWPKEQTVRQWRIFLPHRECIPLRAVSRPPPVKTYTTQHAAKAVGIDWATLWRLMCSKRAKFEKPRTKTTTGYIWTASDVEKLRRYCKKARVGRYSQKDGLISRAVKLNGWPSFARYGKAISDYLDSLS